MKQVTSLTAQCRLLHPGKPSYHSVASSCWQFGWATNWMERRRRWRDCEETQFKCPLDETNKCKNWAIKPETQHRSPASTKGVLKVSHLSFRGLNRPITTCLTFSTQRSSVNTTFRCVQVIKLSYKRTLSSLEFSLLHLVKMKYTGCVLHLETCHMGRLESRVQHFKRQEVLNFSCICPSTLEYFYVSLWQ